MLIFNKVRRWIATRLYPLDLVELTKSQITQVNREVRLDLEAMSKEEVDALLTFAHATYSNRYFALIVNPLIFAEIDFIARFSRTTEEQVLSRGTINGVERVKEEFMRLQNAFTELHQKDLFNKFDVV